MLTKSHITSKLAEALPAFRDRYHVKRLGLFGSVARDDAGPDSDIDILVEFSQPVGMEIVDLAIELEDLLQAKVDLVSKKAIQPRMLPYIEKDVIYVAA